MIVISNLRFVVVTIFLFTACLTPLAQRPVREGHEVSALQRDRMEIERLENEWNLINEISDADGKQRLLAADSYHVGPSGRLYTKQQDVEDARLSYERKQRDKSITKFRIENLNIRVHRGVAVVTATGWSTVTLGGQERRGNSFRVVHVWEKRNARWQLVVDQVTAIAK